MKRTIQIFIVFILVMASSSCDNDLELTPESSISTSSFWKTEGDVDGAVNGMYSDFRATFDSKILWWGGGFRSGHYFWALGGGAWDWTKWWENELDATTSRTNWSKFYILINDANLILKHTPDIEFSSETRKNETIGHAYFVRAFAYYWIARIWGDAPLALDSFESPEQELELVRSPASDLFAQAKLDADAAVGLLPDGGTSAPKFYANKSAVNMLRADLYLWTAKREGGGAADLQTAKAAVDAVFMAGYGLETNFEEIFRNEASNEIIFTTFYSEFEDSRSEVANDETTRTANGSHPASIALNGVDAVPQEYRGQVPTQNGVRWLGLSEYFLDNILNPATMDSRTDVSWQTFDDNGTLSEPLKWINKYTGQTIGSDLYLIDDVILYRFSEAILLKAEIENALGNSSEALAELNKIAARAYGIQDFYGGLTGEDLDNAILNERILEFVLEGKSYFDIVRFGEAFNGRIPSLVGRSGDKSGNILLVPVNQDVINRNTQINQTLGFN
ncbi:MAG: RagB/SusD family nutrient uptake outer membrane protein [Sediminicola sp.]